MFSHFVPMPVETLGQPFSYGWRVTARCVAGKQDGMSRHKECVYRAELDMGTLVWTRGKGFPRAGYAAQFVDRETLYCCSVCQWSGNQLQHGSASRFTSVAAVPGESSDRAAMTAMIRQRSKTFSTDVPGFRPRMQDTRGVENWL